MSFFKEAKIVIPDNVVVVIDNHVILVRGVNGSLSHRFHDLLNCRKIERSVVFSSIARRRSINSKSLLGTSCSLLNSMIIGVSVGFEKKLQLVGIGYRVVIKDNVLLLSVGYSHVVRYELPEAVSAICPSSVDIVLSSPNKQLIGQVAADLRAIRPPESFSGKGIRYLDEVLRIKEVKKK